VALANEVKNMPGCKVAWQYVEVPIEDVPETSTPLVHDLQVTNNSTCEMAVQTDDYSCVS
jgi:hypothetical protein